MGNSGLALISSSGAFTTFMSLSRKLIRTFSHPCPAPCGFARCRPAAPFITLYA